MKWHAVGWQTRLDIKPGTRISPKGNKVTCKPANPSPFEMSPHMSAVLRATWPPELHIAQTFYIAINTLEMNFMKNETLRGKAINAPLRSHCAKFSNLRADRLLYYPVDEEKLHWKSEDQARAISHILSIQKRFEQRGKNFVLIVVPDKLSVYQDCLLNDADVESRKRVNILKSLIESGASTPDLLGDFKENANEIVDLYFPNNTHLSTRGYVLMAEKLDRFLTATTATNMKLAP